VRNGGSNFAVGGARLDRQSGPLNIRAQVDLFLNTGSRARRTLYIVFGGGNDLRAAMGAVSTERTVSAAVSSLESIVRDLIRDGATDLMIPNLPNIGMTPEMQTRGSAAADEAGRLTALFNEQADRSLRRLSADSARIYRLDVRALAEHAGADPAAFGFTNIRDPCSGALNCRGYLFWDYLHPTTAAHHLDDADKLRRGKAARRAPSRSRFL
jgi:outer membrane lipase/esterase